MYRGKSFMFPKWLVTYIVFFMLVTCVIHINGILALRWPAQNFFVVMEALGGIIALGVVFIIPYLAKLASDVPTKHRLNNLRYQNELYKKLEELNSSQIRIAQAIILDKVSKCLDQQTLQEIEVVMSGLAQR
jgi:hypothetical protein